MKLENDETIRPPLANEREIKMAHKLLTQPLSGADRDLCEAVAAWTVNEDIMDQFHDLYQGKEREAALRGDYWHEII